MSGLMKWKIRVLIPPPKETVTGSRGKTNWNYEHGKHCTDSIAQKTRQE